MRNEKHIKKLNLVEKKILDGPFEEIKRLIECEYHSFGMIFDYLNRDFPGLLPEVFSKRQLGKVLKGLGLSPNNLICNQQPNDFKLQYRYTKEQLFEFALKGQKQTVAKRNASGSYFKVAEKRGIEGRRKNSPRCVEFYTSRGFSQQEAEVKIGILATKGALAALKKTQSPRTERFVSDILKRNNLHFVRQFKLKTENADTFGRKTYFYDFFIPKSNLIIEVNGTYWHCDPRFWAKGDEIKLPGKGPVCVECVWEADRQKVETAKKLGYTVLVLWEHDLYQESGKPAEKEILNEICRTS